MGMMLKNLVHPYIQSTTVLCDKAFCVLLTSHKPQYIIKESVWMEGMMSSCELCIVYTTKHFISLSKVFVLQARVYRGNLATVHCKGVCADAGHD